MTYCIERSVPHEVMSSADTADGFLTIEVPRDIAEREFGAEVATEDQTDE